MKRAPLSTLSVGTLLEEIAYYESQRGRFKAGSDRARRIDVAIAVRRRFLTRAEPPPPTRTLPPVGKLWPDLVAEAIERGERIEL